MVTLYYKLSSRTATGTGEVPVVSYPLTFYEW